MLYYELLRAWARHLRLLDKDPVHSSISEPNPSPLHRNSSINLALVPSCSDVVMVLVGRVESRRGLVLAECCKHKTSRRKVLT